MAVCGSGHAVVDNNVAVLGGGGGGACGQVTALGKWLFFSLHHSTQSF